VSISGARVRNFQSIEDAEIQFGSFTVLVGKSSSGKSAFLRAVRACVRNTAVPANVRQGTPKAEIAVHVGDAVVAVERGKSLSTYKLHQETLETFTKSGRTVPPQIEKVLQFPLVADTDVNFSFQFDRPFLLAETGSQAAQVIGSLTNVSLLHAATREANRRRGEASATLRVRKADVENHRARLKEFADLPDRKKRLVEAETKVAELQELEQSLQSLRRIVAEIRTLADSLAEMEAIQPPDLTETLEEVSNLNSQLSKVESCSQEIRRLRERLRSDAVRARSLKEEVAQMEADYDEHLRQAGQCPVCGSDTSHLHS